MDGLCDEQVQNEYEALLAIYGEDTVSRKLEGGRITQISVRIEVAGRGQCLLRADVSQNYPAKLPELEVYANFLNSNEQRVLLADLIAHIQNEVGFPVLFSCVTFVTERTTQHTASNQPEHEGFDTTVPQLAQEETDGVPKVLSSAAVLGDLLHGEIITDRKSVFQAHYAAVYSKEHVEEVVSTLLQNSKVANATHNMLAYRIRSAETQNALVADCDDDGEKAAGKHILHVLEMLGCENALVVVSRWYGGTPLGPVRFKHIANATRQVVLEAQGRPEKDVSSGKAGTVR
ncbi:Protein IMPACT [Porphyridium purpureum]|uniref:Protein IMPACT n=1 Tax=Porphyridium purpureum TaxID=35688 RepID=A0A5J4Z1T8_PORPP|nr:Protein IMPACT [Porphyridium purpureum]|eukprot:POR4476..scf208_2